MSFEFQLLLALAMLLGNAFFVGAEFGLVSARRSNIELHALNGSRAARITLGAMERISLMLAGAQLGITLCTLIFGAIGEPLIARLLESPLHSLGLSEALLHPIAFVVALTLMVYLHVVIGEMVPKNLALAKPTRVALLFTPPLVLIIKIAGPAVNFLNAVANGCLRLFGITPQQEITSSFGRDEVAGFVKESHKEGYLSKDEEQFLSGALDFDKRTIQAVLLPLDKIVLAPSKASALEIEQLCAATGYSRFPLANSKGEMKGYVHIKDILGISDREQQEPLPRRFIRPLAEVKANTSLRKALLTMQGTGAHLAQVIEKKGEVAGIIALEDLLEELVGRIRDDTQK